ncbi:ABC-type glycerol-3-phosphate transport system substrate-binding protein [Paenibacillus castaneae]|uniref:extracellular solute-binding protein n=1 Tax=Paenibacillus castaneae TaxID=474957 RepID=UPI000C9B940B|nr:extracellular solute-binding protein [Paenibacillus castaneae]NIK75348.1 ABC-type glycerol-3-phosphate transport system substrate-binding protein [Paenibacillus castaneae]
MTKGGKKPFGFRLLIICLSIVLIGTLNVTGKTDSKRAVYAESERSPGKSDEIGESASSGQIEPYYEEVRKKWEADKIPSGGKQYIIEAAGYVRKSDDAAVITDMYQGQKDVLLWSSPKGWVEYEVEVEQEGLYEIVADYAPLSDDNRKNRRPSILSAKVNDVYPFREARSMSFEREFKNQPQRFDTDGNELQSSIEEIEGWKSKPFRDSNGAYALPLLWHLQKGRNVIRIEISQEPFAVKSFTIKPPTVIPAYEEVRKTYPAISSIGKESIVIEAEQFSKKNSTSIQAQYDRDALTTPKSLKYRSYNTLGAWGWYKGGHAVTWEFEVPEDGLYKIGMRMNQNLRKNLSVSRSIYIDGKIPFKELQSYSLPYTSTWKGYTIQDDQNQPMEFYLSKGTHTIMMEAGYEPYMPVITKVEQMVATLKEVLEQIKSATGNRQDDQFRVWDVEKEIPGVTDRLKQLQEQLIEQVGQLRAINKDIDSVAQTYRSSAKDIEELLKKPEKIPTSHLTLGAVLEQLQEQYRQLMDAPLQVDKFYITPVQSSFPKMEANFFEKVTGMFAALRYSFEDRNQLGKQNGDVLNVWMMMGRDYVDELQMLADEKFTPEYGVQVKVNLVQSPDLLILAKASGILPDIALGVPGNMPFDMALRGAALDITKLPGGNELISKYHPGAMLPFYYNGGYYGIPETTSFKVLFYRKDILKKLDLEVPDTWDDVYKMIPTLLQKQYNFYVPPDDFSYMFFQNGADIYTPDGMSTALNKPEAFDAFKKWTDLFNIYGLERQVQSFYNQFRSGTMPIGIADFNMYMQLMVAAPDILNEWTIAPIPGTRQPDGSIIRWASGSNPTSAMLFNDTPEQKRDLSWQFLQWYLSDETQTDYGLNMEQFRGEAFRWNTANVQAFANMPWKKEDLKVILEQWKWLKDVPNVPGGYMSTRELANAWNRAVVLDSQALETPRIALEKGIKAITGELVRKQQEFYFRDKNGKVIKTLDIPQIQEPWKGADIDVE